MFLQPQTLFLPLFHVLEKQLEPPQAVKGKHVKVPQIRQKRAEHEQKLRAALLGAAEAAGGGGQGWRATGAGRQVDVTRASRTDTARGLANSGTGREEAQRNPEGPEESAQSSCQGPVLGTQPRQDQAIHKI